MTISDTFSVTGMRVLLLRAVVAMFCLTAAETVTAAFNPDSLRDRLPQLSTWSAAPPRLFHDYDEEYGFDSLAERRVAGTFTSDSFTEVGQCFLPDSSCGTVFFLHGYLDHTGTLINGITACFNARWAVAAMDLPGHGLSGGERGAIDDFSEYAAAFDRFFLLAAPHLKQPFVFIGHSTGVVPSPWSTCAGKHLVRSGKCFFWRRWSVVSCIIFRDSAMRC